MCNFEAVWQSNDQQQIAVHLTQVAIKSLLGEI